MIPPDGNERMTKVEVPKWPVERFRDSDFGFLSDFGFRISDFFRHSPAAPKSDKDGSFVIRHFPNA
jgi:hypothetical protein